MCAYVAHNMTGKILVFLLIATIQGLFVLFLMKSGFLKATGFIPTTAIKPTIRVYKSTASTNQDESTTVLTPTVNHEPGEIFLIILVTTVPKTVDRRDFIRNSWGGVHETTTQQNDTENAARAVYVAFMLGRTGNETLDQAIDNEASEHGDIIRT